MRKPSDTKILDWLSAYHGCEPMQAWSCDSWVWQYMGVQYKTLREAAIAAMKDEAKGRRG